MNNPVVVMGSIIDAAKVSFVGDPVRLDRTKLDSLWFMPIIVDGCMIDFKAGKSQCAETRAALVAALGLPPELAATLPQLEADYAVE